MVYFKINIALMVREKTTKQVKHCVLSVYTIGPCFVFDFALGDFFCKDRRADEHRIYPIIILELSLTKFSGDCQKNLANPQNFLRIVIPRTF